MVRKIMALLLCCCMVLPLAACGSQAQKPDSPPPAAEVAPTPSAPAETNAYAPAPAEDHPPATEEPGPASMSPNGPYDVASYGNDTPTKSVEFQKVTFNWTDKDGYVLEMTYKFSPWIKAKDSEVLSKAWSEVSNNDFPDVESLKIENTNKTVKDFWSNSNGYEAVYAVGRVEFANKTNGFDVTENNTVSIPIKVGISPELAGTLFIPCFGNKTSAIPHINNGIYPAGFKYSGNHFPNAVLTKNKGGVSFILAQAITGVAPNNPSGNPDFSEFVISFLDPLTNEATEVEMSVTWE